MTARTDAHPSDSTLQGFVKGQLRDSAADRLIEHLDNCPDCRQRAASLPDCTLDVRGGANPDTAALVQLPRRPLPPGVPRELAEHTGYEIVRELGRGGMGVVYLARNLLMDRLEVLKVMNKAQVGRPEAIERFIQEIRSAARLNHPNVATAYSTHLVGEQLVLAMEYVEGDDLGKIVKSRGALPIPFSCFCAREAALGLQRGHELGLVHRDIKPSNLILCRQGKRSFVKIVDFGLAKAKAESPTDRGLTATNQMMGTLGFTAPEQLRDARSADTRADIYSLGCTLYCLLTGTTPFQGNSAYEVFIAQESGGVKPLRQIRPEVPAELAEIVTKMMSKDAAARFRQPSEVAEALLPFLKPTAKPTSNGDSPSGSAPAVEGAQEPIDETDAEHNEAITAKPKPPTEKASSEEEPVDTLLPVRRNDARFTRGRGKVARPTMMAKRSRGIKREPPWLLILPLGILVLAALGTGGFFLFRPGPPDGVVVVQNVPADAEVQLEDGAVRWTRDGPAATATAVTPGPHRVRVLQAGSEIWWTDVTIVPGGEPVRVTVSLPVPVPAPVAPAPARTVETLKQPKEPARAAATSRPAVEAPPRQAPPAQGPRGEPLPPPGQGGFRPPPLRPGDPGYGPPDGRGPRPPPPDGRGPRPPPPPQDQRGPGQLPPRPPGPGPGGQGFPNPGGP